MSSLQIFIVRIAKELDLAEVEMFMAAVVTHVKLEFVRLTDRDLEFQQGVALLAPIWLNFYRFYPFSCLKVIVRDRDLLRISVRTIVC